MVLRCTCGGAVELTSSNGAEYPEPRVEFYECASCNKTGTLRLTERGESKSGCLTNV